MLETTILSNLVFNEEYYRRVFPYMKAEYFEDVNLKKVFETYSTYVNKYNGIPSIEALSISVDNRKDLNEEGYKAIKAAIDGFKVDSATNLDWLVAETEKFCQDKDLFNSIRRSILILDGKDKELDKGAIPKLLSESLGISFDTHIGHEYSEDAEERYEYYHREDSRLPFDIEILNKITKGGLPKSSLTLLLATTGAGKSLVKCHMAANAYLSGKNVLYITMELAEKEVMRRIDAGMLDVTVDEVEKMEKDLFLKRISRVKSKTTGRLVVKEYPTGSAHVGHFRHLLNELALKKNFKPDIIFVDYLNICASSRIRGGTNANSYTIVKAIAEELRSLAMEYQLPIVSSSQLNRSGYENTDVDLTNTSESMGITHTADAIFALITSEELEEMGHLMIKQLKNRWGDLSYYRRFVVGIDRAKMKIFNLEESAQKSIQNEPKLKEKTKSSKSESDVVDETVDFTPISSVKKTRRL